MPRLFPYNRFTMSVRAPFLPFRLALTSDAPAQKLIKRLIFPEHMALLVTRQDEILLELKGLADEGFPKAEEEWERSVAAWQKRQEKAKADGMLPEEVPSTPPDAVSVPMDVDKADDGEGKDGKEDKAGHPPGKRYRLTERMKGLIWNLVCLSNECCRIENEKNTLEGSTTQVSEQGLRKVLYQKIVAAFPEGWMSSGQISRDVSVMKKKFEKEAMENDS
ncbi:hypothetical protein OF83DRAFT_1088259 [Amylostereum chailletii]|nr:hypothetical protein OF83DRAFT_1088259 [Amylostereum chailletii]